MHDFVTIDNEAEYVLKRKSDILQFNWPNDTLFDTWMLDIVADEQFEEVEIDEDEAQDDEVQIIDTTAPDPKDEEGEVHQLAPAIGLETQNVDMIEEQSRVKVMLFVQNDNNENPRVKIDLEPQHDDSSLASLVATYSEDP